MRAVRIVNGSVWEAVDLPEGSVLQEWGLRPEQGWREVPSDTCVGWVEGPGGFVPPPGPSLQQLRGVKRLEIKRARDAAIKAGILWKGLVLQTNEAALAKLMATRTEVVETGADQGWRMKNNSWLVQSASDFLAMCAAAVAHINNCYATQAAKEAELSALEGAEGIYAYDATAGFPPDPDPAG